MAAGLALAVGHPAGQHDTAQDQAEQLAGGPQDAGAGALIRQGAGPPRPPERRRTSRRR